MRIAIIGIGLIGGSMALVLKRLGHVTHVIGVDASTRHSQLALEKGMVDEVLELESAVAECDVVVVSVPVDAAMHTLQQVLDVAATQVVVDVGSTKKELIDSVAGHPRRGRFVPCHPMWGTEFSGPEAATSEAFADKACVICNREQSDSDALEVAEKILGSIGMHIVYMNAEEHDLHTAYVSHISHITSFALANTVLEKEREEDAIFELASGGFESTVRLAKSNPNMWVPIFRQNRDNVLDVLNEHISQLRKFKACLEKENWEYLRELIEHANEIKRILK
jgi:prephenate dehydrogenase